MRPLYSLDNLDTCLLVRISCLLIQTLNNNGV